MVKTARKPAKRPARSPAAQPEGVRERVLRAASTLFASKGFDGCSLREVAAAAGVGHSLLLYHFGSMEELWKTVVDELLADSERRIEGRLGGLSTLDPVTQLRIFIEQFIRFSMERPELHRILTIEGGQPNPRTRWLVDTHLRRIFENTKPTIVRGQEEGTVRRFDPALIYYAVLSLGGTPAAFAQEIEAVTGRRVRDEGGVAELAAMIGALVFEPARGGSGAPAPAPASTRRSPAGRPVAARKRSRAR